MAGHVFHHSKRRLLAAVALCGVIGLIAAGVNVGAITPVPAEADHAATCRSQRASRTSWSNSPQTSIVKRRVLPQDVDTLVRHTELMARVMISRPVTDRIARRAGVPPEQLGAEARTTANVPSAFLEPASEERASDILIADRPYRIEVEGRPFSPILDIYSHAPTTAAAKRLVDAGIAELRARLQTLARRPGRARGSRARSAPARNDARL